jgi:chromosome segregation ATPase
MNYEILIGALAFIGMIAGVIKPIITLNNNITALTASVDSLKEIISELKDRLASHGKQIDDIQIQLADHEARLRTLEK